MPTLFSFFHLGSEEWLGLPLSQRNANVRARANRFKDTQWAGTTQPPFCPCEVWGREERWNAIAKRDGGAGGRCSSSTLQTHMHTHTHTAATGEDLKRCLSFASCHTLLLRIMVDRSILTSAPGTREAADRRWRLVWSKTLFVTFLVHLPSSPVLCLALFTDMVIWYGRPLLSSFVTRPNNCFNSEEEFSLASSSSFCAAL